MRLVCCVFTFLCFWLSSAGQNAEGNALQPIRRYSRPATERFEIDSVDHKARKLDGSIIKQLARIGKLPESLEKESGCKNQLYYHSRFQVNKNIIAGFFAADICSCCGYSQLLLATFDTDGHLIDATVVAEKIYESECIATKTAVREGNKFTLTDEETCTVTDGPNQGDEKKKTTIWHFEILSNGKIKHWN